MTTADDIIVEHLISQVQDIYTKLDWNFVFISFKQSKIEYHSANSALVLLVSEVCRNVWKEYLARTAKDGEKDETPAKPTTRKTKPKPTPPIRKSQRRRGRPSKAPVPPPTSDTEEDENDQLPEMLPEVKDEDEEKICKDEEKSAADSSDTLTNSLAEELQQSVSQETVITEHVDQMIEVDKDESPSSVQLPSDMPLEVIFTPSSSNSVPPASCSLMTDGSIPPADDEKLQAEEASGVNTQMSMRMAEEELQKADLGALINSALMVSFHNQDRYATQSGTTAQTNIPQPSTSMVNAEIAPDNVTSMSMGGTTLESIPVANGSVVHLPIPGASDGSVITDIQLTNIPSGGDVMTSMSLAGEISMANIQMTSTTYTMANMSGGNMPMVSTTSVPMENSTVANIPVLGIPGVSTCIANMTSLPDVNLTQPVLPAANDLDTQLSGVEGTLQSMTVPTSSIADGVGVDSAAISGTCNAAVTGTSLPNNIHLYGSGQVVANGQESKQTIVKSSVDGQVITGQAEKNNKKTVVKTEKDLKSKIDYLSEFDPKNLHEMYTVLADGRLRCNVCPKEFDGDDASYVKMRRHVKRLHLTTKIFQCSICNKSFKEDRRLQQHMLTHDVKEEFSCKICHKIFSSKDVLDTHNEVCKEDTSQYPCIICGATFNTARYLKGHMRVHRAPKFKCSVCGRLFNRKDLADTHLASHSNEEMICSEIKDVKPTIVTLPVVIEDVKCKKCQAKFASLTDFHQHSKTCVLQCDVCHKTFDRSHKLTKHRKIHAPNFKCTLCVKAFTDSRRLREHMCLHTGEVLHTCHICGQGFRVKDTYNTHMYRHEVQDNPELQKPAKEPSLCSICGASVTDLSSHVRKIHLNRVHKCEICSEIFDMSSQLDEHVVSAHGDGKRVQCHLCHDWLWSRRGLLLHMTRNHSGARPYRCTMCGNCYSSIKLLDMHKKVHRRGGPVKCQYCDKRVVSLKALSEHVKLHTHERSFICDICGKGFVSNNHLGVHRKTHATEMPYSCCICHKAFKTKARCAAHLRTAHGAQSEQVRSHICQMCQKAFTTRSHLRRHMSTHTAQIM